MVRRRDPASTAPPYPAPPNRRHLRWLAVCVFLLPLLVVVPVRSAPVDRPAAQNTASATATGTTTPTVTGTLSPTPDLGQPPVYRRHAGLVVQFNASTVFTACVDLGSDGWATGEEILRDSRLEVAMAVEQGQGAAVCQIETTGCDINQGQPCFCACDLNAGCWRWLYYHLQSETWQSPAPGEHFSSNVIEAGDVDGWVWGSGGGESGGQATMPTVVRFATICVPPTPTATPTTTPTPTATPPLSGTQTTVTIPPGTPTAAAVPPSAAPAAAPGGGGSLRELPVKSPTPRPSPTPWPTATATPVPSPPPTPTLPPLPPPTALPAPTNTLVPTSLPTPTVPPAPTLEPLPTPTIDETATLAALLATEFALMPPSPTGSTATPWSTASPRPTQTRDQAAVGVAAGLATGLLPTDSPGAINGLPTTDTPLEASVPPLAPAPKLDAVQSAGLFLAVVGLIVLATLGLIHLYRRRDADALDEWDE